jgi:hypothetical protein
MAVQVEDLGSLQKYIDGVMTRANHHAGFVREVVFPLITAIIWTKDTPIEVRGNENDMKNVLRTSIKRQRYVFTYNHGDKVNIHTTKIDMRLNNLNGKIVKSFTNETTTKEIQEFFGKLADKKL